MKARWKVQPAPTGKFRSFHVREWPQYEREDDRLLGFISCEDGYDVNVAKSGEHRVLSLWITGSRRSNFKIGEATTLAEAKAEVEAYCCKHADRLWPTPVNPAYPPDAVAYVGLVGGIPTIVPLVAVPPVGTILVVKK